MRRKIRWIAALLSCLLPLAAARADLLAAGPFNTGERFLIEDGVVYWIGDDHAEVVDCVREAEHITVRAQAGGKPVRCARLWASDGMAKSIVVEPGVAGLSYVYIRRFPALETVDIHTATFGYSDYYDDYHAYLLDCPRLTSFRVRENTAPVETLILWRYCPNLTVDVPPGREDDPSERIYDFEFTGASHPGAETCVVPEGATWANIDSDDVRRIELPASLQRVIITAPNAAEIVVSEQNPRLMSLDGVLYDRNYNSIDTYPSGKRETRYVMPPDISWGEITSESLTTIVLSDSLSITIPSGRFDCPNLTELVLPSGYQDDMEPFEDNDLISLYDYLDHHDAHSDGIWGRGKSVTRITVEEGNETLTSVDGLLLSKDGKELLRAPAGIRGTLTLPEGVERIVPFAFWQCTGIESLILPATMRAPDSAAPFLGLGSLKTFAVADGNPSLTAVDGALFSKDGETLIARPANHGEAYTVPIGTRRIAPFAFLPNDTLRDVRMPSSVTAIGTFGFADNIALGSIALSPAITEIGENAFLNCYRIEKLLLPAALENVEKIVGFSEMQELDWYDHDSPERIQSVTPLEVWIPGTLNNIEGGAFTFSNGGYGRLPSELLFVVVKDSEGHYFAREVGFPYCFPDQVSLARQGLKYAILTAEAGERVGTWKTAAMDTPGPSYPEGTALLLLGESGDFHIASFGGEVVYVVKEKCRIAAEARDDTAYTYEKSAQREALMYALPSTGAETIGSVLSGEDVEISAWIGPWYRVCSDQDEECYMLRRDLDYASWRSNDSVAAQIDFPAVSGTYPVYAYPSLDARVVGALYNGESISVSRAARDGWMRLVDGNYIYTGR